MFELIAGHRSVEAVNVLTKFKASTEHVRVNGLFKSKCPLTDLQDIKGVHVRVKMLPHLL